MTIKGILVTTVILLVVVWLSALSWVQYNNLQVERDNLAEMTAKVESPEKALTELERKPGPEGPQ